MESPPQKCCNLTVLTPGSILAIVLTESINAVCENMKNENKNLSDPDTLRLLHELEARQLELETQNKALILARDEANATLEKLTLLYDSVTAGCFTFDRNGAICELNLSSAGMLGRERTNLINSNFKQFITPETLTAFNDFLQKVFETDSKQTCEVKLKIQGTPLSFVHFEGVVSEDKQKCVAIAVDITGRKRVEATLLESENRYRGIIENVPIGMFQSTPEGKCIYVNPAFSAIFGYASPDELIQIVNRTSVADALYENPERRPLLVEQVEHYKENWKIFENRYRRKDGQIIDAILSFCEQADSMSGQSFLFGFVQDVTELKQAEKALREREFFFRESQRAAFIGSYKTDFITGVWKSSEVLDRIFGIDRSYTRSVKGWLEIIHPEDREMVDQYLKKEVIASRKPFNKEYRIIRKSDGAIRWVSGLGNVSFDTEGNIISMIGTIQDITERKQAEAALQESEERLRLTLEAAEVVAWEINLVTGKNYEAGPVSRLFGRGEGFKHTTVEDLTNNVHPEDRKLVMETMAKALRGERDYKTEYRILLENGGIRWIDAHGNLQYDPEGKPVRMLGVATDITDSKQTEAALKESETRLRELNATKDKFFSIIAHDLKNPFQSIMGFSDLLTEQINEKNYGGIAEYAGIIQNSSQRAMNLLTNLLEWSRSQTGKMEFNPEYIEIIILINEAIKLADDAARQKSITIYKELPRYAAVFADKAMLGAILRNLISNAIKFTNPGGRIVISAEQKQDELMVAVSDNGVGIEKDAIAKLFRIEENLSTRGTQNERGTGLGLILCKEFIEKHGGKIWVESEPGKGSKFIFTLSNRIK